MYPAHHGIVYNQFYDRNRKESYSISDRKSVMDGSWYGGTPLWVLAEQQGMLSASYYYLGTDAAIQHTYPSYFYRYSNESNMDHRIQEVVNWLRLPEDVRPHFISFYIPDVDAAGHKYGPESKQVKDAVLFVDAAIGKMNEKVSALGLSVNFIFLSDHGMAEADTINKINVRAMIDTTAFRLFGSSTTMHIYAKDAKDVLPAYEMLKKRANGFKVYLRDEIPARWHYNTSNDSYGRIGDIIVVPDFPKVIVGPTGHNSFGVHGFDPAIEQMHASFYAWGPQFKKHKTIKPFENIHVYPLVCSILGLNYSHDIDGKKKVLKKLLK
jgi:predicted AlkP superfamily pyrophosphatase or phosphodiesterase